MILKDLIERKDYDLIEVRVEYPKYLRDNQQTMLFGYCRSEKGQLISLDGDSYSPNEELLYHKEWIDDDNKRNLTVVIDVDWQ